MSRRTTAEILDEALVHFEMATAYAQHDLADQLVIDAASLRLAAGIDALSRLDEPTRQRLFGRTWRAMTGMRNRIAHGYLLVDSDLVRDSLEDELPEVLTVLRRELDQLQRRSPRD